jgi:hypothetical protein
VLFLGPVILFIYFWRNVFWTFSWKENPKKHLILELSIHKVGSLFLAIYITARKYKTWALLSLRSRFEMPPKLRAHRHTSGGARESTTTSHALPSFLSFPFLPAPLQQAMESAERGGGGGSKRKKHCGGGAGGPNGSTTTLSATHLRYATWGGGGRDIHRVRVEFLFFIKKKKIFEICHR